MFEYHGWATVRDLTEARSEAADGLTHAVHDAVARMLTAIRNDLQVADLRIVNGSCHLWLAGLRNHQQQDVVEVFRSIAAAAPWSYGLLHVHDDEAEADWNGWVVWVMKRGSVVRGADLFLSPHVGEVEDSIDDE